MCVPCLCSVTRRSAGTRFAHTHATLLPLQTTHLQPSQAGAAVTGTGGMSLAQRNAHLEQENDRLRQVLVQLLRMGEEAQPAKDHNKVGWGWPSL